MSALERLRRLRPDGLAARFALLLAAALIAANLIALALLSFERVRLDRAALVEREAERIVSLVPAIEAASPAARRAIAGEASTRFSRVSADPEPIVDEDPAAPKSAALTRDFADALGDRRVRASVTIPPGRDGLGGPETVAVSIALTVPAGEPAQWLNLVSRGNRPPPPGPDQSVFLIVLGLSLASVLGVALLYVRRLTRPLGDLAEAARAAGRGDRSARVAEDGPREMRVAAAAFNDMQGRIARFDAERMRTLAAVGHDLRTPITSLRIRAELLDEADAAPMIRTLDEMTVMANGLVAYARGAREAEAVQSIDLALLLARLCEERGAGFEAEAAIAVMARPSPWAAPSATSSTMRSATAARRGSGCRGMPARPSSLSRMMAPASPRSVLRKYSSPSCAGKTAAARRPGARASACRSRAPSSWRMAG